MSIGALDPLLHNRERLCIVATLAALPDGDAAAHAPDSRTGSSGTSPAARAGDADRDAAAAVLGEHFAQGRLTLDELSARLDATLTATTHGELSRATWDLPGPHAIASPGQPSAQETPKTRAQARPGSTPTTMAKPPPLNPRSAGDNGVLPEGDCVERRD